jgi:hypothetical protein
MEVIYKNSNGEQATLRTTKPFFISKISGVGSVRNNITTFSAPEQDGAFFVSSSVDMRNITLEGSIIATSVEESFNFRRQLLKIFTPKLQGTFIYREKQINCIVEEASFAVSSNARTPAFFISLLCPSPFFEALSETTADVAKWEEKFSFPLEIVETGIEFGSRKQSQFVEIVNEGDVLCGLEIIFKALSDIENPELLQVETGSVTRILTTMTAGQEIHIYTHFANKKVVLINNGVSENAFNLIDTNSTFFQLQTGVNTLRYDATANIDQLEVEVKYRPAFLGV